MALTGIDISSYQEGLNVGSLSGVDFIIIKATEGTGYVNPYCNTQYQEAKAKGTLRGVYHFLANKVNTPEAEAAYFVTNIKGYIGDALLALDNENSAFNDQTNVGYALTFLQEVERLTGVKPLIYMNASCVNSNDWTSVINNGNALWVAAYQASAPNVNWPNNDQAAWQFTDAAHVVGYGSPVDEDTFWGDAAGWARYAAVSTTPAPTPVPPVDPQPVPTPTPVPTTPPAVPAQPTPGVKTSEFKLASLGALLPILVPLADKYFGTNFTVDQANQALQVWGVYTAEVVAIAVAGFGIWKYIEGRTKLKLK